MPAALPLQPASASVTNSVQPPSTSSGLGRSNSASYHPQHRRPLSVSSSGFGPHIPPTSGSGSGLQRAQSTAVRSSGGHHHQQRYPSQERHRQNIPPSSSSTAPGTNGSVSHQYHNHPQQHQQQQFQQQKLQQEQIPPQHLQQPFHRQQGTPSTLPHRPPPNFALPIPPPSAAPPHRGMSATPGSTIMASTASGPATIPIPVDSSTPVRSDSLRIPSGSSTRYHHTTIPPPPPPPPNNNQHPQPVPHPVPVTAIDAAAAIMPDTSRSAPGHTSNRSLGSGQTPSRRRTDINAPSGHWVLGKTVGAGSMGKVKLAKNSATGEQAAIKIVPRHSTEVHRTLQEKERADHSKDVRTSREAAIVGLVRHPYICGLHDVVRTQHHWYMFFEYVNGGQMLEYIISHGRLKEKQARKFARQIGSALDYCHHNSIVHRDLKIENILISKTGDIKIIDFGLSNLFSPTGLLKTFCGSLYFAAPELLQARQYTGPEVDIWSFGVVLYVLVCGKVPFDDQSMPQLHAKIKKGYAEYPPWLSSECRSLIARMLVTDPRQRATLHEVMSHPWMNKGYNGIPIDSYLPHREPLTLPLDPAVIEGMVGFNFGASEEIMRELTKALTSEGYRHALLNYRTKKPPSPTPEVERKRGVFEFYKRRNSASRDNLAGATDETTQLGTDPINAFHPMISIYFLVRERLERERAAAEARRRHPITDQAATSIGLHSEQHFLPEIHTSGPLVSSKLTASDPAIESSRSRTANRIHEEEEYDRSDGRIPMMPVSGNAQPSVGLSDSTPKKSTAGSLLRRFSTKRYRDFKQRSAPPMPPPATSHSATAPSSDATSNLQPSMTVTTPRKSQSVRRSASKASPSSASLEGGHGASLQPDLLSPASIGDNFSRKLKALARSTSVNSAEIRRRFQERLGHSHEQGLEPPYTSGSDHSSLERPSNRHPTTRSSRNREQSGTRQPAHTAPSTPGRAKSVGGGQMVDPNRARWKPRAGGEREERHEDETHESRGLISPTNPNHETLKPVYLKGLFSASTTSNKPLKFIHADIIRVLSLKRVRYTEIKGGFSCTYAQSKSNRAVNGGTEEPQPRSTDALSPLSSPSHRRKISFNAFRKDGSSVHRAHQTPSQTVENRSFSASEESDGSGHLSSNQPSSSHIRRTSGITTPRGPGETTTQVQNDLSGRAMILRFEIFIVKVPLFQLYGIQFKKVEGNIMQYKNLAQDILDALRL